VHGLKQALVVLADHDPRWARRFAARATELRRVLGERARLVQHLGSTAVPGLAAKPNPRQKTELLDGGGGGVCGLMLASADCGLQCGPGCGRDR
jgi:hypothetical protein